MLALDSAIWTGTISSKSTRGDHVHTNATRPEVAGEVKGQSGHAGLGDSVVDRLSLHGVLVVPAPGNGSVDQQPKQYNAKLICGQEKYSPEELHAVVPSHHPRNAPLAKADGRSLSQLAALCQPADCRAGDRALPARHAG